jgi:hypothetical protein
MSYDLFISKIDQFCGYQGKWNVKREEEILQSYGRSPEERDLSQSLNRSVMNLDKPPGPTSHQVAYWVKGLLKVEKAGHGGTLGI